MTTGKCPKCEQPLSKVKLEDVLVEVSGGKTFHGVSYVCPYCGSVLSVAIDPVALNSDLVSEVVSKLRG